MFVSNAQMAEPWAGVEVGRARRTEASILHADLDCFFAAVEQRDDPGLRGKPVVVGGGVVMAASYEARAFGVRGAMGGAEARRLCPGLIVVPPRSDAYSAASKEVFAVFDDITPWVEPMSVDEAFLDVGGLRRISGDPASIAATVRRRVREEVGLPISIGVARTKFLAKVASRSAKPDGLFVVDPADEDGFLHPLPVERMWGVGAITAAKLRRRGLYTVGDLARAGEEVLVTLLGGHAGRQIHAVASHRDPRRLRTARRRRSIGAQRATGARRLATAEIDSTLVGLVDRVMRRLRAGDRLARTVTVRFRFADFERMTRAYTLDQATDRSDAVLAAARELLRREDDVVAARGLTMLGVTLSNLESSDCVQLALPLSTGELGSGDRRRLDHTVDEIRERFGTKILTRASLVGRDIGVASPTVPILPDVPRHPVWNDT